MSRKHFKAFAEVLKLNGANYALCLEFADLFAIENERFDYDKFMLACGHTQTEAI